MASGPRTGLARLSIEPVVVSAHVGENLLDHLVLPHVFRLKDGFESDSYLLSEGHKHSVALKRYHDNGLGP